jgi:hypothetical protein
MPIVQVKLNTDSSIVSAPYTLPFTLPYHGTDHTNHPIYFKSIGASFTTDVNLPSTMSISLDNIDNDPKHTQLFFPTYRPTSLTPKPAAYHYSADMHLGDVSTDHIIQGKLTFTDSTSIQLPQSISIVFLIDSEYM